MSGLKRRFFTLCLVLALALSALAAVRCLTAPQEAPAASARPSAPRADGPTLAFFGDGTDGWCQPLFARLEQWAETEGWTFLSYDCKGSATARRGQLEDLARVEQADVAVLCPVGEETEEALSALDIPVIVLDDRDWPDVCRVGPAEGEFYRAAGDWFGRGAKVLLLTDLPDDPRAEEARRTLEESGTTVLEHGVCWAGAGYAQEYVTQAMTRFPEITGVLAFSRAGALGAGDALGEARSAKVLCLESGPEVLEDLALGRVDAVAEVSAREAAQALETAIPAALAGRDDGLYALKVTIRTLA